MLSIKMTFLLLRFGALKRKPESARPMDAATMNKVLDYRYPHPGGPRSGEEVRHLLLRAISNAVPTLEGLTLPPVLKTIAERQPGLVLAEDRRQGQGAVDGEPGQHQDRRGISPRSGPHRPAQGRDRLGAAPARGRRSAA